MRTRRGTTGKSWESHHDDGAGKASPGHEAADRVHGVVPVVEALRAGRRTIEHISIVEGARHERLRELMELAKSARVPVRRVPRLELERGLGNATHQGVVAKIAA